jgi:hypothetical protein
MLRHIIPIGDSGEHYQSDECPCNPVIIEGDRFDACIHRAFDKREHILAIEIFLHMRCADCLHYIDDNGNHCEPPPPYYE